LWIEGGSDAGFFFSTLFRLCLVAALASLFLPPVFGRTLKATRRLRGKIPFPFFSLSLLNWTSCARNGLFVDEKKAASCLPHSSFFFPGFVLRFQLAPEDGVRVFRHLLVLPLFFLSSALSANVGGFPSFFLRVWIDLNLQNQVCCRSFPFFPLSLRIWRR